MEAGVEHFLGMGNDILREIFLCLDGNSLARLLCTCHQLDRFRSEPWIQSRITLHKNYHTIYTLHDWTYGICLAAENNDLQHLTFFVRKRQTKWNIALKYAAKGGHKELIEDIIKRGAYAWSWGIYGASLGGHQHLVEYFEARSMSSKKRNIWNEAMRQGALGGHKHIVEYCIQKGANSWNLGLRAAVQSKNKELVNYFIEKGAKDWKGALLASLKAGDKELHQMFDKLCSYSRHHERTKCAVAGGNIELLMLQVKFTYWRAIRYAVNLNQAEMVAFCLQHMSQPDLQNYMRMAIDGHKTRVIQILLQKGADPNLGMAYCIRTCHWKSMHIFINWGVTDWTPSLVAWGKGIPTLLMILKKKFGKVNEKALGAAAYKTLEALIRETHSRRIIHCDVGTLTKSLLNQLVN